MKSLYFASATSLARQQRRNNFWRINMNHLCNMVSAFALGAGLVYFLDPTSGRRRRGLVRDQFIHGIHKTGDAADAKVRDLRNRAYGTYHEVRRDVQQVMDTAANEMPSAQKKFQAASSAG
jgi:hypothetical protein